MIKAKVNGIKGSSRYIDPTTAALRSYIFRREISSQRLSKVRAGSHLPKVLQKEAPAGYKKQNQTQKQEEDRVQSPIEDFHSFRSDKGASSKQLPVSKFMENYLSQRNLDEGILSAKEANIYDYFKEKYGLMGKYLGEDVLKEGLLVKQSKNEGNHNQDKLLKKSKNMEAEIRDQYLLSLINEEKGSDFRDGRSQKVMNINREIIEQILKEEKQEELDALIQLQTEQTMQVFNELQDIKFKGTEKGKNLAAVVKTPPSKVIVKGNFLRTFVNIDRSSPFEQNDRSRLNTNQSLKRTFSMKLPRPQTDYLVFRTKKKREHIFPNIGKISSQLKSHKFEGDSFGVANPADETSFDSFRKTANNIYPNSKNLEKSQTPNQLSSSKLSLTKENFQNKKDETLQKNPRHGSPISKVDKTLIDEEIEFLNYHKNGKLDIVTNFATKKVREPIQYYHKPPEIENHSLPAVHPDQKSESTKLKESESLSSTEMSKLNKNLVKEGNSNLSNKTLISKLKSGFPALDRSKNILSRVSPKLGESALRLTSSTPTLKNSQTVKRDLKTFYPKAVFPPKKDSEIDNRPEKQLKKKLTFVTKLVTVKKEEIQPPINSLFFTSNQIPANYDIRQEKGMNTFTNNFGDRYWRSNFRD